MTQKCKGFMSWSRAVAVLAPCGIEARSGNAEMCVCVCVCVCARACQEGPPQAYSKPRSFENLLDNPHSLHRGVKIHPKLRGAE